MSDLEMVRAILDACQVWHGIVYGQDGDEAVWTSIFATGPYGPNCRLTFNGEMQVRGYDVGEGWVDCIERRRLLTALERP